ncbi:MAG TPA: hypothetical protein VME23_10825 [Terracidiphilus sp.]|nr:hypothetical protein [Terracidiphilus sp.]
MSFHSKIKGIAAISVLFAISVVACRKEERAVEGVAQNAVKAEQQVQAKESQLDLDRAQLDQIPLPTKSLYIDIHDPSQWANPFLVVGPQSITLRILLPDANTSTVGQGTLLRPVSARRQELQLRPADLDKAIVAIPAGAWHYGRVIAIAESPEAPPKERAQVRRNLEAALRDLNNLGLVVEEWPGR